MRFLERSGLIGKVGSASLLTACPKGPILVLKWFFLRYAKIGLKGNENFNYLVQIWSFLGGFRTRIPEEQTSCMKQYFYEHGITCKSNINKTILTLHVCKTFRNVKSIWTDKYQDMYTIKMTFLEQKYASAPSFLLGKAYSI